MTTSWAAVLVDLHDHENELSFLLQEIARRHEDDPQLRDECARRADLSAAHVARLVEIAAAYDLNLDPVAGQPGPLATLRDRIAHLFGGAGRPDLLLLDDLRRVHLVATGAALDWDLVGEVARNLSDANLRQTVTECQPETEEQVRWSRGSVTALGPRILTTN